MTEGLEVALYCNEGFPFVSSMAANRTDPIGRRVPCAPRGITHRDLLMFSTR